MQTQNENGMGIREREGGTERWGEEIRGQPSVISSDGEVTVPIADRRILP